MPNDKQELEHETEELEVRPAGNKDLWLFLIVVDVVFLCVFGFFIYKHFSARLFTPAPAAEILTDVEVPSEPEEVLLTVQTESPAPVLASEPEEIIPILPATPEKTVAAVLKEEQKPAPVVEPVETPVVTPVVQKESIVVSKSKGKYRQVTFYWFGEGKKVEIVSGFTMSKPKALKKVKDHFEVTLGIAPGTYKFLYVIDGENQLDPYAPQKDGRSVLEVK